MNDGDAQLAASREPNIAIGDFSALHYWMHRDGGGFSLTFDGGVLKRGYAQTTADLARFNVDHPLFGGPPISVLVPNRAMRAHTMRIVGRLCTAALPEHSFVMLREGLYMATPELTYIRLGNCMSEIELAEVGTNLCAHYYCGLDDSGIYERKRPLVSADDLKAYAHSASGLRGSAKASRALRWVLPNSGSPMETKVQLLFRLPARMGGFALPFTHMNYDVADKRSVRLYEQRRYVIDLASPLCKTGLEYDGREYHQDSSADNRRRNALKAIGWEIFPLDMAILRNTSATKKLALQIGKHMRIRFQKPKNWEAKHLELRKSLGLPV